MAAAKAAKLAKVRGEEDAGAGAGAPEEALPAGRRSARRTTRSSNANEEARRVDDDAGESGKGETPAVDPQGDGDSKG